MSEDARAVVLAGIRRSIRAGNESPDTSPDQLAEWASIPRGYRRSSTRASLELQRLLADRLRDYDAKILQSSQEDVTHAIAKMLTNRGLSRILVPDGFDMKRLPRGFDFILEAGLSAAEMNRCDGILTESTLAVAETGTIVLQNVPGQGRRAASLVPDYHLCLVEAARIVATVPEAIALLQATATLPTTFISGPSATADIEMTRIKGVHGPRFLDVILISSTHPPVLGFDSSLP